jgi:hypothetical protein
MKSRNAVDVHFDVKEYCLGVDRQHPGDDQNHYKMDD